MPREITIVLPATQNDEETVSQHGDGTCNEPHLDQKVKENVDDHEVTNGHFHTNRIHKNIQVSPSELVEDQPRKEEAVTESPPIQKRSRRPRKLQSRNNHKRPQHSYHQHCVQQIQSLQQQQRHQQEKQPQRPQSHRQERRLPLQQTQHHLLTNGDSTHGHYVILDKAAMRSRPASAAPRVHYQKTSTDQRALGDVRLAVTDTYDLDLEHRDIMTKALRSYSQHCQDDLTSPPSTNINENINKYKALEAHLLRNQRTAESYPDSCSASQSSNEFENCSESDSPSKSEDMAGLFKLAQCRLHFYDDDENTHVTKMKKKLSHKDNLLSPASKTTTVLYPLKDGDGVLVDSVGHVYRSKQIRPWSALPTKHTAMIKTERDGIYQYHEAQRFDDTTSTTSSSHHSIPRTKRINSSSSYKSTYKVVTLKLNNKMSQPITHSAAFQRRNQTTHMWTDSSALMSRSLPTAGFLHRNFGSSASSPRSSRDATSERTSPAGKPSNPKPSSSYSYDGGFFVGAHSGQADYFVIHPDWVSEAMTIKKLSIGDKTNGPPLARSASLRIRPHGRRCLSAPPKQRNPITWDNQQSEPVDISSKK